ncbi:MAG: hypothetical protein ACSW8J_03215, partial [bacterium]
TNGKRILMIVHWVCSLLICMALTLFIINPRLALAFGGADGRIPAGVIVLSILIITAYVALAVVQAYFVLNLEKKTAADYFPVGDTDNGPVRISTPAIEQMVRHAVHDMDGISELRIDVTGAEGGIDIAVDTILVNGTHVPTLTTDMQQAIGKFVESACGVKVCSVSINVIAVAKAQTRLKAHTFTEWLSRVGKAIKEGVARILPKKQATEVAAEDAAEATVLQPVDEETAPVAVEAEPVAVEAEPVAEEPEPVAVEAEPVAEEAEPVAENPEPVAVEYTPKTVEPEVVIIEPELDDEPELVEDEPDDEPEPMAVEVEPEVAVEPETVEEETEAAVEVEPEIVDAEPEPVVEAEPEIVDAEPEPVVEVEPEIMTPAEESVEAAETVEEAPVYDMPVIRLAKTIPSETDVEE